MKYSAILLLFIGQLLHAEALPNLANYTVFVANPNYKIRTLNGENKIQLGMYGTSDDQTRRFDFVSSLLNNRTGQMNAMTWQIAAPVNGELEFTNITDLNVHAGFANGVSKRLLKEDNELVLAYLANDPPSKEKIRTMINTWPISNDVEYVIDLSFRLGKVNAQGEFDASSFWIKPYQRSADLLWQMKAEPSHPSMSMVYDVDPKMPGRFQLTFNQRIASTREPYWTTEVGGLEYGKYVDVLMKLKLTDAENGKGFWSIWVNGRYVDRYEGQTLIAGLPPHRWAFGQYMYHEKKAVPADRYTFLAAFANASC